MAERKRLLAELRPKAGQPPIAPEALQSARERLVEVRKELTAVKTSVQVVEPKSNRSKRTIAVPAMVLNALVRHRVRQLEARMAAGKRWNDSGFVFTTPNGGRVTVWVDHHALDGLKLAKLANAGDPVAREGDVILF